MEYNTNMPIIYLRLTDAELAEIAPVLDDLALEIYKQRGKGHISRSEAAVQLLKQAAEERAAKEKRTDYTVNAKEKKGR